MSTEDVVDKAKEVAEEVKDKAEAVTAVDGCKAGIGLGSCVK